MWKFVLAVLLISTTVFAEDLTPVGRWKTIDDSTGEPRAIVELYLENSELKGKIVEAYPKPGQSELCVKCEGEMKNKPILGMVIVWGLKGKGEEWADGHILDPEKGSTYSVKIKIIDNGAKLKVRGYMGFSLLGRTQEWLKVTAAAAPPAAPIADAAAVPDATTAPHADQNNEPAKQ